LQPSGNPGPYLVLASEEARPPDKFSILVHSLDVSVASNVPLKGERPGVDVRITIFCDFRQFSAKKLAFFSKTNVMIKI
jgi:hypothetical protein